MLFLFHSIVESGERYAFIFDSPPLEYETTIEPCEIKTVGRLFHPVGYGIALPQFSPFTDLFSLATLKLRKSGTLETLQQKWIQNGPCAKMSSGKQFLSYLFFFHQDIHGSVNKLTMSEN